MSYQDEDWDIKDVGEFGVSIKKKDNSGHPGVPAIDDPYNQFGTWGPTTNKEWDELIEDERYVNDDDIVAEMLMEARSEPTSFRPLRTDMKNDEQSEEIEVAHERELDWEEQQYQDLKNNIETVKASKYQVPSEFEDYKKIMEFGAKKYGADNWLEPNGAKSSHKEMCASIFRHAAQLSVGQVADPESGQHPALHLAARALMVYTRYKRGLRHAKDLLSM